MIRSSTAPSFRRFLENLWDREERKKLEVVACVFVRLKISRPDPLQPILAYRNHPSRPVSPLRNWVLSLPLIVARSACLASLCVISSTRFQKSRRSLGRLQQFFFSFSRFSQSRGRIYYSGADQSRDIRIRHVATWIHQIGRKARVKRPAAHGCSCKKRKALSRGSLCCSSWLLPSSRLPCDAMHSHQSANLGRGMQVISSRVRPRRLQSTILHLANTSCRGRRGCPALPAAL